MNKLKDRLKKLKAKIQDSERHLLSVGSMTDSPGGNTGSGANESPGDNVEVYILADRTRSMVDTIQEVRVTIDYFANEVFGKGNTKIAVWGLEDHFGEKHLGIIKADPTNNTKTLETQIARLTASRANGDEVENYECGWNELGNYLSKIPRTSSTRRAIITFMETAAHGQIQEISPDMMTDDKDSKFYDIGCPFGVYWRSALSYVKSFADQWFLIDCDGNSGHYDLFKTAKRMCVNNGISTEHYVELGSAKKIIPPLLCGMVEKTRGEEFYSHFLERVEKQQKGLSQKIAGYLGPAT